MFNQMFNQHTLQRNNEIQLIIKSIMNNKGPLLNIYFFFQSHCTYIYQIWMGYTNINIFIVVVTDQVLVTLSNVTSKNMVLFHCLLTWRFTKLVTLLISKPMVPSKKVCHTNTTTVRLVLFTTLPNPPLVLSLTKLLETDTLKRELTWELNMLNTLLVVKNSWTELNLTLLKREKLKLTVKPFTWRDKLPSQEVQELSPLKVTFLKLWLQSLTKLSFKPTIPCLLVFILLRIN